MRLLILIIGLALYATHLAAQTRYYVHATATGTNDGSSWANAFTDLQSALVLADAGDSVWVAEGLYKPTSGVDRVLTFAPHSGVVLLGGFAGTESTVAERDWAAHPVTLSGDIGVQGDSLDNSYNVVYLQSPDSSTVVDGFVILHGRADFTGSGAPNDRRRCGAGLYMQGTNAEAYATVRNCVFKYHYSRTVGGAMAIIGQGEGSVAPTIESCVFEYNRSNHGGAIARIGSSWVERTDFKDNIFRYNYAVQDGGAVYFTDAERTDRVDTDGCVFYRNECGRQGSGLCLYADRGTGGWASVTGCTFEENKCLFVNTSYFPSALVVVGQNFYQLYELVIDSTSFVNNIIDDNTINANSIVVETTDVPGYSKSMLLNKINITNNTSRRIARIVFQGSAANINVIDLVSNSMVLTNFSLLSESANMDGCRYRNTTLSARLTDYAIIKNQNFSTNNISAPPLALITTGIVTGNVVIEGVTFNSPNTPFYIFTGNSTENVQISNLYANTSNPYVFIGRPNTTFNITNCAFPPGTVLLEDQAQALAAGRLDTSHIFYITDPLFVNPDSGDLRLQPCSPLIDKGNNAFVTTTTDLEGQPRIVRGTVDIGAYESPLASESGVATSTATCAGVAAGMAEFDLAACGPYQYAWSGPQGTSGTSNTGLLPGGYQFTITDSRGDQVTTTIQVPERPAPALTATATPVECGATTGGTALATGEQGLAPYTYAWPGGTAGPEQTNLAPGTYTITVSDAMGCSTTGTVEVGRTGSLSIDVNQQNVTCFGGQNGLLDIQPANGLAPFTYLWNDGTTTAIRDDLAAGQYAGTLTDSFGCQIIWVLPVGQPGALQLSADLVFCSDSSSANGRITVVPQGGTGPYSATWSPDLTGFDLQNLPYGPYTLTLTDANGCTLDTTFLVGVTSGTNTLLRDPRIGLYPNPVRSDLVHLLVPDEYGTYGVVVTDALGRVIRQEAAVQSGVLSVSEWPRGWYAVTIKTAQGQRTLRLLRER
jgi:SprB repeat